MTFTTEELKAIERRTPAERDALDAYWNSLSEEKKRADLERWRKDRNWDEAVQAILGLAFIVAFVIAPALAVAYRLIWGAS